MGRDLLELVGRGDISGMSFGFRATNETWDFKQDPCVRTVTELLEITFTATPAYIRPVQKAINHSTA
jgi:HK97 family phage prohead protease